MRCLIRFPSLALVAVLFVFQGGVLAVEVEPVEVQRARELIKNNGRSIVYFALPTYTKQVDLGRLNSRYSPSSRIQPVGGGYSNSRN